MPDPENLKLPVIELEARDTKYTDGPNIGKPMKVGIHASHNDGIRTKVPLQCLIGRAWPGEGPLHLIVLGEGIKFTLDEVDGVGRLEVDVPAMKALLGIE
jgi:hypothetical protein